jgi:putative tryptophan/tyrosine transport system substrate-binding protein
MKRREFITLLGGAAAVPLAAGAQQLVKIPLIAALMPFVEGDEEAERRRNAFERGLRQLGWTKGQSALNIAGSLPIATAYGRPQSRLLG